jgi:hypothetical protein
LGLVYDPSDPCGTKLASSLPLGVYVDNFIYFLMDPGVKSFFCFLLAEHCKVEFMGIVE